MKVERKKCHSLSVGSLVVSQNSLLTFHQIKHHAPQYLSEFIPVTRQEITLRRLRNATNTTLPRNRLSSHKNSLFPTIRTLPDEVRSIQSTRSLSQAVAQAYGLAKPPMFFSVGYKQENNHNGTDLTKAAGPAVIGIVHKYIKSSKRFESQ